MQWTPVEKRDVYTIQETMGQLLCGRNKVMELIATGELVSTKVGKQYAITKESVRKLLQIKESEERYGSKTILQH